MIEEMEHTNTSFLNRKFLVKLPYGELVEKKRILEEGLKEAIEHQDQSAIDHLQLWILEVEEAMNMLNHKN